MSKHKRLPYHSYFTTVVLLSFSGLAVSLYLLWSHYRNYTDINYSSFCAISRTINCDTVSQSSWSILFGLPVALWGAIGYVLFLLFLIPTYKKNQIGVSLWSVLTFLGFFFLIAAIFFGYVSATKINSYCILCILSYTISFLLFFSTWITLRRFDNNSFFTSINSSIHYLKTNIAAKIISVLFIIGVAGFIFFIPHYWKYIPPPLPENIATGITKEGHPWIGAEHPKLTIEEYSDYQCFQCYKMHYLLRSLIVENPDRIRLIHHHYPMDHEVNSVVVPKPFYIGSGKMALLAIYSGGKKKFWQTNDLLYELGRNKKSFNIKMVAEKTEIPIEELAWALQAKEVKEILRYDIWHGMKLGITGTPTFIIHDKVYPGTIPPEILKEALQ